MKFKVTGQNKDSGSKMTLEIDAASKGEAQRRATSTGMYVTHVEPADHMSGESAGELSGEGYYRKSNARRSSGPGILRFVPMLLALAVLLVVAYFAWPFVRQFLNR